MLIAESWHKTFWLKEVIEVVGRGEPLASPAGVVPPPNGDRSVIKVAGVDRSYHLCLEIEGQTIPFLEAKSSRYPEQDAVDIALRLGTGAKFQVIWIFRR